jgi:hypothetical protein
MANSGIRVNLGLNDRLSPSLRRATRDVRRFSQNSSRSFRGVGDSLRSIQRIAGLAFAAFTTGRAARAITDFAKAGDEIAKTARQIGIGVEALQELRFAAERSGVDTNTLTTSLEQMNLRVGQLRNGQGALTTALARTNPMLRQQLRDAQSSEEAFELLIAEIEKQPNAQARAALATAAFGRAGQDLIVMAENGVDGLRALREEARAYGNIMDEEATSASEAFTDSMSNLRATFLSFRNQALTPLIRALQPLIKQFTDFITQNRELITLKVQEYFQHIKNAVEVLVKLWDSGFLPAILAGVGAFIAITKAIQAYQAMLILAKGAQIAFNAIASANPWILGVTILVGAIVLLIRHWDYLKEKVQDVFGWITRAIQNDIQRIIMFFQPLIDLISNLWSGLKGIMSTVGGFLGNAFGGAIESPTSRNESLIRNESISRSQVDINVGGLPQGSTVRQQGGSPSVTLNYGFATGGF